MGKYSIKKYHIICCGCGREWKMNENAMPATHGCLLFRCHKCGTLFHIELTSHTEEDCDNCFRQLLCLSACIAEFTIITCP